MTTDGKILEKMILRALSGKGAHVEVKDAFAGLDWKLAGMQPEGVSHSIFQLLNHMAYWNQWVGKWLAGQKPSVPKHAQGSWPGKVAPQSAGEWQEALRRLDQGLREMTGAIQEADLLAKRGTKTPLGMLQTIALHNSYHLGQVVLLRQRLGAWPPPSGGLTW
jgi:uncharacterized damage-inducible protein DinB